MTECEYCCPCCEEYPESCDCDLQNCQYHEEDEDDETEGAS